MVFVLFIYLILFKVLLLNSGGGGLEKGKLYWKMMRG
jgi:hypothetical protein